MAITGVILLVIGLVFPRMFLHNVELITVEMIEKKLEHWQREFEAIPVPKDDEEENNETIPKLIAKAFEAGMSFEELTPRLHLLMSQSERVSLYGIYCDIAGGILCLIGFVLWWFKLQRYQDQILKAEAERILKTPL